MLREKVEEEEKEKKEEEEEMEEEEDKEKDDGVEKRQPDTTGIFPTGLPMRRRHGHHRRQHRDPASLARFSRGEQPLTSTWQPPWFPIRTRPANRTWPFP